MKEALGTCNSRTPGWVTGFAQQMWRHQFFISASQSFSEPIWKVLSKNTHTTPRNEAQCVSTWLIKFLGECCRHQTILIILNDKHQQFVNLFIFLRVKIKSQMNHRKQNPYQRNKVSIYEYPKIIWTKYTYTI